MLHYYYYYIFSIGKPAKSDVILVGSEITLVELGCKEFNWVNCSGVHDVLGSELGNGEPHMKKTWLLHWKIKNGTQGFQWLKIRLPMQGTWFRKIPHAVGQPSLCVTASEPVPWRPYSATREATVMRGLQTATKEEPWLIAIREIPCGNEDPVQPKQ